MGWQDRQYNQSGSGFGSGGGSGGGMGPIASILFGSLSVGTYFGIRVRVHATLIILIACNLIFAGTKGGMGLQNAATSSAILFGLILLHEFGHCFGARSIRGSADDVLLWPFGGLAYVHTPRRPWPSFVATACGPLVNLLVCAACLLLLEAVYKFQMPFPLNPFLPFSSGDQIANSRALIYIFVDYSAQNPNAVGGTPWTYYILWIYNVSWMLFVFNVFLPIYPMDGGRMLQEILWPIFGFVRSMKFACITGIIAAVLFAGFGMTTGNLFLVALAIVGIMTCYQTLQAVRAGYLEEETGIDYAAIAADSSPHKSRKVKKGWFKTAKKRAQREAAEQLKIDAILEQVHNHGLHSLTWWQKRTLKKATERQRQRDLAERL